ncbi:MAG: hypothetical protein JSS75_08460 [Bacteroidetes bacterium]|nr:hypothetical protein [Bacteroidota bacterium]
MTRLVSFISLTILLTLAHSTHAQEKYISKGEQIARFPLHFNNGFLFASAPVIDTLLDGRPDTIVRSFLIDPRASNDGSYLPADSSETQLGTRNVYVPVSTQRTMIWKLAPSLAKYNFKKADTAFRGVIGYGILKQYVTVIDLADRVMTLYALDPSPDLSKRLDTDAIHVPYFDDAILKYCHCNFPTIWLEPDAAPLLPGRWHLSLADRQSVIYEQSLPGKLKKKINDAMLQDSLAGKTDPFAGIQISKFVLGGVNLAKLEPHRPIDNLPDIFKDLSVTVMGTVAMDVLRHFPAIIIDPTRGKILLCNY